jgi:hypothetical protein
MNMSESLAPVALFVFNRPDHTERTLAALRQNVLAPETDLVIFSDAPKRETQAEAVAEVRKVIKGFSGFRSLEVIEREKNMGLAPSIISGVSELCRNYGRVIVLEDDLISSPYFLSYMNAALDAYEDVDNVFSISGFNAPSKIMRFPDDYKEDVYFCPRNCSWGWGTWWDRWSSVDWDMKDYEEFRNNKAERRRFNLSGDDMSEMLDLQMAGKISSWAIRFSYHHFKHNGLAVYPRYSYIHNGGLDDSGVHTKKRDQRLSNREGLLKAPAVVTFPPKAVVDEAVLRNFRQVNKYRFRSKAKRVVLAVLKAISGSR